MMYNSLLLKNKVKFLKLQSFFFSFFNHESKKIMPPPPKNILLIDYNFQSLIYLPTNGESNNNKDILPPKKMSHKDKTCLYHRPKIYSNFLLADILIFEQLLVHCDSHSQFQGEY